MKRVLLLAGGLLLCFLTIAPITAMRKALAPAERLGYIPSPEVAYFASLDYKLLLSEILFYNTTFYFGSMVDTPDIKPDYKRIYQYIDTSTRLNPYNIDSYYFGQAILTWDAGMVKDMNRLLLRGLKKRSWDFYIPLFLGFNYYYFLGDNLKGAGYFTEAASRQPNVEYLPTLASRLYYESDKTALAIDYLKIVQRENRLESVRRAVGKRLEALQTIRLLEAAVESFRAKRGGLPHDLNELVSAGFLEGIPRDPYGGRFYLDLQEGRVRTTSKLANPEKKNERH